MTTVPLKEAKERLEERLAEGEFMVRLEDGKTLRVEVGPLTPAKCGGFASAKGWFSDVSDDFGEPLENFSEYMQQS